MSHSTSAVTVPSQVPSLPETLATPFVPVTAVLVTVEFWVIRVALTEAPATAVANRRR